MILTRLAYYAMRAIHHLSPPLTYNAIMPFYRHPIIMWSPVKKQEREGKPTRKREEEEKRGREKREKRKGKK